MKKRYLLFVALLLVLLFALVGCGMEDDGPIVDAKENGEKDDETAEKVEKVTFRMGFVMAESSPTNEAAQRFADKVKERTDGNIEVILFPNSTLGSDSEVLEQAKLGTPVIGYNSPSGLKDLAPDLSVLGGPFLVDNWEQLEKVVTSDFMKEQEKLIEKSGIKILAFNWYFGARHVISDRVVESPADLKGLKVRSAPLPMWEETIKAMGANPTSLEWAEVYTGLEQGIINGAEAPLETLYSSRMYEVATHISKTGHFNQVNGWLMSEEVFSSLSDEYQQILLEEAKAAGDFVSQKTIEQEKEFEKKLKEEGVIFTEPDVDAFREATMKVYDILSGEWTEGTYEKVKEVINK